MRTPSRAGFKYPKTWYFLQQPRGKRSFSLFPNLIHTAVTAPGLVHSTSQRHWIWSLPQSQNIHFVSYCKQKKRSWEHHLWLSTKWYNTWYFCWDKVTRFCFIFLCPRQLINVHLWAGTNQAKTRYFQLGVRLLDIRHLFHTHLNL